MLSVSFSLIIWGVVLSPTQFFIFFFDAVSASSSYCAPVSAYIATTARQSLHWLICH
jgi:hypothetical protein